MTSFDSFRSVKTEYQLEFLMKRFGGIEFFKGNPLNSADILNEKLLNQLVNITRGMNSTRTSEIDTTKIASLFRIHPAEASVCRFVGFCFRSNLNLISFRFGTITKVGRRASFLSIFSTTHCYADFFFNKIERTNSTITEFPVGLIRYLELTFKSIVNYKIEQQSNCSRPFVLFSRWLLFRQVFLFFSLTNE